MFSVKKAKELALNYLNKDNGDEELMLFDSFVEFEYGWLFKYNVAGVFNPRVAEIDNKIDCLKKEGISLEEIEKDLSLWLSESEITILDASTPMIVKSMVFVDKETKEIRLMPYPAEVIVQEIIEEKTGESFEWSIIISQNIKEILSDIKELRRMTGLQSVDLIRKIKQKESIFTTRDFRELNIVERDLIFLKIKYEVNKLN